MAQHDGNNSQKQRGWINYFRVLAGAYLIYLAYRLLRSIWDGTAEMVALNGVSGAAFAAAGAAILWREWRAYQYAKAHKDDPDTWTLDDDPAPEAGTAEPEEPEEPKDREKGRAEP